MMGYLNRPDATSEALDTEGYYHTGDAAHLDDEGNSSSTRTARIEAPRRAPLSRATAPSH